MLHISPSGHRGPRNRHSEFSPAGALAGAFDAGAAFATAGEGDAAVSLEDR
ncbi:MAG: hypothetical protein IPI49_19195 [Myxococcales bacterium]|nr:hypothetical protein [Myxococcales bacterium]